MDDLADFTRTSATYDGKERTVYRTGSGPGVVVLSEMPGITPEVADFARRLRDVGLTVAMPSLFGTDGKPMSGGYVAGSMLRACVSREFHVLATGSTSPIATWVRQLAHDLHAECGGPGVGVIGMCFTGGLALAAMVEPSVVAPVMSQPAMPAPMGAKRKRHLGLSADDLRIVKDRAESGCQVLGLRFTNDSSVPAERFDTLRAELGEAFIAVEIDNSPGNSFGIDPKAHSVVTNHLTDEPGHPTRAALDQVLEFFGDRLGVSAG